MIFELLVRQGESAFRKKNFNDAAMAFSKATKFAVESKNADRAMATATRWAQCFEQLHQHRTAADKLFELVERFPNETTSPAVHLRACWNLAKAGADNQQYLVERLASHTRRWPNHENTNRARLWLGNAHQHLSQWKRAADAYVAIVMDSPEMLDAVEFIGPSISRWIDEKRSINEDWKSAVNEIANTLLDKIGLTKPNHTIEWTETRKKLLLVIIDVALPADAVSAVDVIEWLDKALSRDQSDDDWRVQALARRTVAIAKQAAAGNQQANLELALKALPNDAAIMAVCLQGFKNNLTVEQLAEINPAIVVTCDKALVDESVTNAQYWKIERAVAQVAGADLDSGIAGLADLASENPKSLKIQIEYARALTKRGNDSQAAMLQWRRLASKVKKDSESWYEAKYNIAQLMMNSDQVDDATKLIKYLQATAAGFQASKWKARFERLLNN